jgi:hypothetical protein
VPRQHSLKAEDRNSRQGSRDLIVLTHQPPLSLQRRLLSWAQPGRGTGRLSGEPERGRGLVGQQTCKFSHYLTSAHTHTHTHTHTQLDGSSLGFFLNPGLSREFFLATVLLHLHCLIFGFLGWVSVTHTHTPLRYRGKKELKVGHCVPEREIDRER